MVFYKHYPSTVGVLLAVAVAVLIGSLILGLYIGFAFIVIWALNVLGFHIAYGASEVLAIIVLTILFGA